MNEISKNKMFGGWHKRFSHFSHATKCDMTFAIFLPPQAESGDKVPVLYWLSGLTCNDENFSHKAGAQRIAAELGIALVMPDTSPRGSDVPDDEDGAYDFGLGAGFYVNATQMPWSRNYNMYDYVVDELPKLIEANFPVNERKAISGHSMGGHGALTIGLKNSDAYTSISAFSPIVNPIDCPWGEKALSNYLGEDKADWHQYDACYLFEHFEGQLPPVLIDQGDADDFLAEQLKTDNLITVLHEKELEVELNYQAGYDHSYFFIASFIEAHLRFHAKYLIS